MDLLIIILSAYFILSHIGLYLIFEKAGVAGWKILIPFYGIYTAVKLIRRPIWWFIVYYIPFIGFISWVGIIVELLKHMGIVSFWQHVLGVVAAPFYLAYVGFNKEISWNGYEFIDQYKKSRRREWADAISFAVILATIIRALYIEAFTIPTSSMEKSLLVGDFLFVSKVHYGSRIPNTPIFFPFAHHTMWFTDKVKSYSELIKLPYARLPKFQNVKRNEAVVFNFPAGDTVVVQHQDQVYDQMVRDMGRDQIWKNFDVISRPVDKRENYIKRCVALPGDQIQIKNTDLYIDGELAYQSEGLQFAYYVKTNGSGFNSTQLMKRDITEVFLTPMKNVFEMHLTQENLSYVETLPQVEMVEKRIRPEGYYQKYGSQKNHIFPNTDTTTWTEDNFGPLTIPYAGQKVDLSLKNLPVYEKLIRVYEGNQLEVKDDRIYINGEKTDSYEVQLNYYWMMGDNRHNSQDSRFWGFVPEDHIVGKAVFVWLSLDPNQSGFSKVRWDRLFTIIHSDDMAYQEN